MSEFNQPRCRLPFLSSAAPGVDAVGVVQLRCRVKLQLDAGDHRPGPTEWFVVDSGASYSRMTLAKARQLNISIPPVEAEIDQPVLTAQGRTVARVRPGRLRAWWGPTPGGYPFDWPILFMADASPYVPSILGLAGVMLTCRWTFDGRFAPDAPEGALTHDDTR